jgi:hypothetical protein
LFVLAYSLAHLYDRPTQVAGICFAVIGGMILCFVLREPTHRPLTVDDTAPGLQKEQPSRLGRVSSRLTTVAFVVLCLAALLGGGWYATQLFVPCEVETRVLPTAQVVRVDIKTRTTRGGRFGIARQYTVVALAYEPIRFRLSETRPEYDAVLRGIRPGDRVSVSIGAGAYAQAVERSEQANNCEFDRSWAHGQCEIDLWSLTRGADEMVSHARTCAARQHENVAFAIILLLTATGCLVAIRRGSRFRRGTVG